MSAKLIIKNQDQLEFPLTQPLHGKPLQYLFCVVISLLLLSCRHASLVIMNHDMIISVLAIYVQKSEQNSYLCKYCECTDNYYLNYGKL